MTFYIMTFGCKVNRCESDKMANMMKAAGWAECGCAKSAGVVIINSCTVTSESDRKLRRAIHRIKKSSPECMVVLTGCMPQIFSQEAQKLSGVDLIVAQNDKNNIANIIKEKLNLSLIKNKPQDIFATSAAPKKRTRAFLKIQDGCDRFCSYCIIPYARGHVRSATLDDVRSEAQALAKSGYKEIVLVGINLSSYGKDIGLDLSDAVEAVCSAVGEDLRVRLGSLEPDLMTDSIIKKLSRQNKLCPQFHLALQSGCDSVLKRMRRRYTAQDYLDVIAKIRKHIPNAVFTTDLIVGFPGETEEDFDESLHIIKKARILKVHVFPYSARKGTLAAGFDEAVTANIKTQRAKLAAKFCEAVRRDVLLEFIGSTEPVLYETKNSDGFYEGYTPSYISVKTPYPVNICGKVINTVLENISVGCCIGKIE